MSLVMVKPNFRPGKKDSVRIFVGLGIRLSIGKFRKLEHEFNNKDCENRTSVSYSNRYGY